MERMFARWGKPQQTFRAIHVAGTNGKGSTSAMLESCLRSAGFRTGLYTSPHLCRYTERIRVAGNEISRESVERLVSLVLEAEPEMTFFEVTTAIAYKFFAEEKVEWAVSEAGLGGRLDATNVLQPKLSILTRLDLDHQEILGRDLCSIAREKAGIIKPKTPVISAPVSVEVAKVLRQTALEQRAMIYFAGEDFNYHQNGTFLDFECPWGGLNGIKLALQGPYQAENAALCLAALFLLRYKGWPLSEDNIRQGLTQVQWPGRWEWIGDYLLDGAHNSGGAQTLASTLLLAAEQPKPPYSVIMGLLEPRDPDSIIGPIRPLVRRLIFVRPKSPRALSPEELALRVPGSEFYEDLATAMEALNHEPGPKVITGSLYLVGEARALLLGETVDPWPVGDPIHPPQ